MPYLLFSLAYLMLRYVFIIATGFKDDRPFALLQQVMYVVIDPGMGSSPWLWFLHTLFLMFVLFPFVEILRERIGELLVGLLLLGLHFTHAPGGLLQIKDVLHYGIFFYAGYLFMAHYGALWRMVPRFGWLAVTFMCIVLTTGMPDSEPFELAVGFTGILAILYFSWLLACYAPRPALRLIRTVGFRAYDIYLLHYMLGVYTFGLGVFRVMEVKYLEQPWMIAVALPIATIALSIAASRFTLGTTGVTGKVAAFSLGRRLRESNPEKVPHHKGK